MRDFSVANRSSSASSGRPISAKNRRQLSSVYTITASQPSDVWYG